MLLASRESSVELRPLRYQFPARGEFHDDNWLVIEGRVTTPSRSWSFQNACLLTDEAREVSGWLRAVAAGEATVSDPDAEGRLSPSLSFLEPYVAFSLAGRSGDRSVVRVHLSRHTAPPGMRRGDDGAPGLFQYAVEVERTDRELLHAADVWEQEMSQFPTR